MFLVRALSSFPILLSVVAAPSSDNGMTDYQATRLVERQCVNIPVTSPNGEVKTETNLLFAKTRASKMRLYQKRIVHGREYSDTVEIDLTRSDIRIAGRSDQHGRNLVTFESKGNPSAIERRTKRSSGRRGQWTGIPSLELPCKDPKTALTAFKRLKASTLAAKSRSPSKNRSFATPQVVSARSSNSTRKSSADLLLGAEKICWLTYNPRPTTDYPNRYQYLEVCANKGDQNWRYERYFFPGNKKHRLPPESLGSVLSIAELTSMAARAKVRGTGIDQYGRNTRRDVVFLTYPKNIGTIDEIVPELFAERMSNPSFDVRILGRKNRRATQRTTKLKNGLMIPYSLFRPMLKGNFRKQLANLRQSEMRSQAQARQERSQKRAAAEAARKVFFSPGGPGTMSNRQWPTKYRQCMLSRAEPAFQRYSNSEFAARQSQCKDSYTGRVMIKTQSRDACLAKLRRDIRETFLTHSMPTFHTNCQAHWER